MTLTKKEAKRLNKVALDLIDLAHCFHTGEANEISFESWQDQFAREKEFEAARKQWQRWKAELAKHDLCEQIEDGRELHVVLKPHAREAAEKLRAEARAVLDAEEAQRRFPDAVTIAGRTYRLKVYGRAVRPLNDREYASLKASIQARGRVLAAVLVDRDGCVVDGKHRLIAAGELGLTHVPVQQLSEVDKKALDAMSVELNTKRRQLTKQELAQIRRQLQAEAEALRQRQESLRAIAEQQDVSHVTVRRMLDEAGVEVQGKVRGKDGRLRPAKKASAEERAQRREQIAAMLNENPYLTGREIAEELGVSEGTVRGDREALKAAAAEASPNPAVLVEELELPQTSRLGVNPAADPLPACLEAALFGLEQVRGQMAPAGLEIFDAVSEVLDAVLWRLAEAEAPNPRDPAQLLKA